MPNNRTPSSRNTALPEPDSMAYTEYSRQVQCTPSSSSVQVAAINRIFGLGPNGGAVTILHPTWVPETGITLITGFSGAGKSILLASILERHPEARRLPEVTDDDRPLVELLGPEVDTTECIRWLGKFGLGEARLMTTRYRFLSDGQKFRTRLALMLWDRPRCVVIDEFLSVLDRLTARVVAYNFQKLCRQFSVTTYVATAHNDLEVALAPDHLIDIDLAGVPTIRRLDPGVPPRIPELDEIEIVAGEPDDYLALARYHYVEHLASEAPLREYDWQYSVSQIRVARFRGEPVGIVLCSYPLPTLFNSIPFFRLLNESAIVILRTIIHPAFRGVGLTKRLLKAEVSEHTQCLVACSALGLYFPFFLGAGFEPVPHPRNLRYEDHAELERLLCELGMPDTTPLNSYGAAQAFFDRLPPADQDHLRAVVSRIIVRSNVDYCMFFARVLGISAEAGDCECELNRIFLHLIRQVGNDHFGMSVSEALYFPVQGFIKRLS